MMRAAGISTGLLLAVARGGAQGVFKGENMNGEYVISPTPGATGEYNTKWAEYPGGVEYFDVYMGPITHRYSEIWWTELPESKLPDELIKRFDGKGMAIMGYEVDQVRKKGSKDFDGSILQEDVSVPINMACKYYACDPVPPVPTCHILCLTAVCTACRQPPPRCNRAGQGL
jgi:hypothetical protein